jgi:hypothetical protein
MAGAGPLTVCWRLHQQKHFMSYRLSVLHSFDPLGAKVGGLETFVRDILGNLPDDFTFLMVGVDSTGKRELGRVTRETFRRAASARSRA